MMDLLFKNQMANVPDLRHRLRQLRWFRATLRKHAGLITEMTGMRYDIDEKRLTEAFLNWIELVNQNKHYAAVDRKDFIIFAAGLVLKELIRLSPARAVNAPDKILTGEMENLNEIIRFWPEGFLYTNYCICAIAAIQEQEFGISPDIDQSANDLRTWWTYKENASEMPGFAIAFLDKFLGQEPNWVMPDFASARAAVQRALGADNPAVALTQPSHN